MIVFDTRKGLPDEPMQVPCGQCVGCRLERSRQWAVRCMHEASMHDDNCFMTLTYADEFLPRGGTLVMEHFQKFMKRLRWRYRHDRIRFFHAGEYGDKRGRPHYHACLFGFDFPDKYLWAQRGEFPVWRSPSLESLWSFGQSELGSVTFESAAYVARYIMKKVTGSAADEYYESWDDETGEVVQRQPEYTTMSRRPGIGMEWLRQFGTEVYPSDQVIVRGRATKPPRAYDDAYAVIDALAVEEVKMKREEKRRREDETWQRLQARETVALARVERFARELE